MEPRKVTPRKFLVAILSLIIPGLGHLYAGCHRSKAIRLFVIANVLGLIASAVLARFVRWPFGLVVEHGTVMVTSVTIAILATRSASAHPPRERSEYVKFVAAVLAISVCFGVVEFIPGVKSLKTYNVPTPAMEPTILSGGRVSVKTAFEIKLSDLHRGLVVAFNDSNNPEVVHIKRIVGLPGDRVRFDGPELFINGTKPELNMMANSESLLTKMTDAGNQIYQENFDGKAHLISHPAESSGANFPHEYANGQDLTIEDGTVFVAGDNRINSKDSRHYGPVPISNIFGVAQGVLFRVVPTNRKFEFSIGEIN